MSLDKSLKRRNVLQRRRNVLTRAERVERLKATERFDAEKDSVFGLPKVKSLVVAAPAKPRKEAAAAAEGAAAGAEAGDKGKQVEGGQ